MRWGWGTKPTAAPATSLGGLAGPVLPGNCEWNQFRNDLFGLLNTLCSWVFQAASLQAICLPTSRPRGADRPQPVSCVVPVCSELWQRRSLGCTSQLSMFDSKIGDRCAGSGLSAADPKRSSAHLSDVTYHVLGLLLWSNAAATVGQAQPAASKHCLVSHVCAPPPQQHLLECAHTSASTYRLCMHARAPPPPTTTTAACPPSCTHGPAYCPRPLCPPSASVCRGFIHHHPSASRAAAASQPANPWVHLPPTQPRLATTQLDATNTFWPPAHRNTKA